jgi:hypothetical protein
MCFSFLLFRVCVYVVFSLCRLVFSACLCVCAYVFINLTVGEGSQTFCCVLFFILSLLGHGMEKRPGVFFLSSVVI